MSLKYKKLVFSLKNTKTTLVSQKYTKSIVSSHDCKSPLSLAATTGCPLCKWAPDQNWATFRGGQHIIQTESLLWILYKSLSIHDQWPLISYVFRNGKGLSYAMGFRQILVFVALTIILYLYYTYTYTHNYTVHSFSSWFVLLRLQESRAAFEDMHQSFEKGAARHRVINFTVYCSEWSCNLSCIWQSFHQYSTAWAYVSF